MEFETILMHIEDGICTLTINRPEKLNALNATVFNDLEKAMAQVVQNDAIKSVIITGAGAKAFVAGADIGGFQGLSTEEAMAMSARGQAIFFSIENCPKPVVAAVNGFALGGGCELAMACHFRICSSNAKFGQPEVNLGLIPGYGGTQRLTQLIGKGKSMELQMTAQMVDAEAALQLGLVNHVTTPETLLAKAKEILLLIQTKAPIAVGHIIKCINAAAANFNDNEDSINGFELEVASFGDCFATDDMKEGTTAFIEKRTANFTGK